MSRARYLLPFFFLVGCLPPFQGPSPVPIPWVAPTEICQHHLVPGYRYQLVVPQKGLWGHAWRNSQGSWFNGGLYWYEQGQTLTIETAFPFHLLWAPDTAQTTTLHIVSPDYVPQPAAPCPDY
jgi:hypothetical protein